MNKKSFVLFAAGLTLGTCLWLGSPGHPPTPVLANQPKPTWSTAVKPKALSDNVKHGLDWLVAHQHKDGGWGQGEESQAMGGGGALAEVPNVADTSVSALALIRAGSTPSQGPYAENVRRAVGFVCKSVEASDPDSMSVTSVNGTRVQGKLGPYIDTFMASLLLAEVKGKMPDPADNKRVDVALNKILKKIQKNQKADGSWTNEGWAPVLSQSMASKGLNRAAQAGAVVDDSTLHKAEQYASKRVDAGSTEGSAGVALYSASSNLGALQDSENTQAAQEKDLKEKAQKAPTQAERDEAAGRLQRLDDARKSRKAAQDVVLNRIDDPSFVAGFGSNGGEEFLSYMNISESLVVKGGKEWERWDAAMTQNLSRIQNPDGSWTGHHCITGRNFCTAAALLVLTADRAPVPLTVAR